VRLREAREEVPERLEGVGHLARDEVGQALGRTEEGTTNRRDRVDVALGPARVARLDPVEEVERVVRAERVREDGDLAAAVGLT